MGLSGENENQKMSTEHRQCIIRRTDGGGGGGGVVGVWSDLFA